MSQNIDNWIQRLRDEDMPVFSGTVMEVTQVVDNDETSASDVAQVVLRDASLTGRLLKMANSMHYNPMRQEISTVSRAVMVLGFNQVSALAMSLLLVDSLADGVQRNKLMDEMGQAFHAAVQAHKVAVHMKSKTPEDVFVATLLSRLGNMAFWAFADDKTAVELEELLKTGKLTESEAEDEVLGFSLHELTKGLSKSWNLGELLDKSINGKKSDSRTEVIKLGLKLATESKFSGWNSKASKELIKEVADTLDVSYKAAEEMVRFNAREARDITKLYGAIQASKQIPQFAGYEQDDESNEAITEIEDLTPAYPEPDTNVQLTVLRDITTALQEKPSINIILEMVLEGIYRGVGMDRALFAMLSPDRKTLACKYALGEDSEAISQQLMIDITNKTNVFSQVVHDKAARHVPGDPKKLDGTLSRETIKLLGTPPYLVMPVMIKDKVIGIFLADRNASKRSIEAEDFIAFQQFCQQANMGLTFLSMQG